MNSGLRNIISIGLGLAAIGFVIFLYLSNPNFTVQPLFWVLFTVLITITTTFGIPLGVGEVSLVPMVALSSTLVIGVIPTAIAGIFSDLLYGLIRGFIPGKTKWEQDEDGFSLAATTTANITMHVFSVLAAGTVYFGFGGNIPIQTPEDLIIIFATGGAYLSVNYSLAGFFLLMRSRAHFLSLWGHMSKMLFYEAIPLAFAPLMARILTDLGLLPFVMLSLSLVLIASLLRDQAKSRGDLERRIQELSSLQAVGRSLTSSLDITLISEAIYREVSKLMPASNFYIALWNTETDEVRFPMVYENDERINFNARTSKQGLTEYIIKTKKPLLIEKNVKATVESLGVTHFGKEAQSWLGVPILAGEQAIGMIAVQSYPIENQIQESFDINHQEILSTIAAQVSVAIQNAWLFTQTDITLAQRVQELNSILETTSDGIMLLDVDWNVVEVNKALTQMLDIFPSDLINKNITAPSISPISSLKIPPQVFTSITEQSLESHKSIVALDGKTEIQAERTISPVRNENGDISGWLCVYRDLTEQIRVKKLQEDLTRMLVHDLRSPIITIQGGLDMIDVLIEDNDTDALLEMVEISRKGSSRMLEMINQLLNLTQLESGEMTIQLETAELPKICEEECRRFYPITNQENISFGYHFPYDYPTLRVDIELIRRVIHNLIDNAIKYSPDGSEIEVWGNIDPQDSGSILMGVKDQGPGINESDQKMLFEKYFTSQSGISRRRGSGLGLYYCKLAVEAHLGSIWVESKVGEGSNFILRLPIHN